MPAAPEPPTALHPCRLRGEQTSCTCASNSSEQLTSSAGDLAPEVTQSPPLWVEGLFTSELFGTCPCHTNMRKNEVRPVWGQRRQRPAALESVKLQLAGGVDAAVAASRGCARQQVRLVISITCGALPPPGAVQLLLPVLHSGQRARYVQVLPGRPHQVRRHGVPGVCQKAGARELKQLHPKRQLAQAAG